MENANYQTKLQNCADLAGKLDNKAKTLFSKEYLTSLIRLDDGQIVKAGDDDMATRYKKTYAQFNALKAATRNPKGDEMAALKKAGVTLEQIEARFQQFEQQFELLEKTKIIKDKVADLSKGTAGFNIFSKNVAFGTLKFKTKGSSRKPSTEETLNIMAFSGSTSDWNGKWKKIFGDKTTALKFGDKTYNVHEYDFGDGVGKYYILGNMDELKRPNVNTDLDRKLSDNKNKTEILNDNGTDSERKLLAFSDVLSKQVPLAPDYKTTLDINTEMSPCDRCFNAIKVATEENITLKTKFGVYFDQPKERRNNPDAEAKSDFIGEQGDITRFLNADDKLDYYFNLK